MQKGSFHAQRFGTFCSTLLARRLSIVFPIVTMAGLFLISSVPGQISPDDPEVFQIFQWVPATIQNVLHIPAYAVLAFAWRWCLNGWMPTRSAVLATFVICLSYGLFEEYYQSFIPGRYASLTDILFNGIGVLVGIMFFGVLHRKYCTV